TITKILKEKDSLDSLIYFGIYYKADEISLHDDNRISEQDLSDKLVLINLYYSQAQTIAKFQHMLPYENWLTYDEWLSK
ncbi:MAG: PIG-L family deacetylase, partial [Bacilli bacterium]